MTNYYAMNNWVGHDYQDGSIEITEEQYIATIEAIISGRLVNIDSGSLEFLDPPPPPEPSPYIDGAPIEDPPITDPHLGDVDSEQNRRLAITDYYVSRSVDPSSEQSLPDEIILARRTARAGGAYLRSLAPNIPLDFRDDKYWLPAQENPIDVPITVQDVYIERDRRFNLGFTYDFGDERGIHHIGTTKTDMQGWSEVTTWADTKLKLEQPDAQTYIMTDTAPALITPMDWYHILDVASGVRQNIWQKSFYISSLSPIPADFRTDLYWAQ